MISYFLTEPFEFPLSHRHLVLDYQNHAIVRSSSIIMQGQLENAET